MFEYFYHEILRRTVVSFGSLFNEIEVMNMVPHKELEQFLGLVSKLEDKISLIQATIGSDSSILGEEINSIHYKGIYDEDR